MDVTSNDDPRRDAMLRRDSRTAAPGAKRTLVPSSARTTDHKEAVRAFIWRKPAFVGQLVFVACACECCCIV
jgi:hypothetical protein